MSLPRREYTSKAIGCALRRAKCESCQTEYSYVVKCEAEGSGTSVLFLDNRGAQERATKQADELLQQQLAEKVDGVPCPQCGWYQRDMITHMRAEWAGGLTMAGILVCIAGGMGLFYCAILGYAAWVGGGGRDSIEPATIKIAALVSVLAVLAGIGICYLRSVLSKGVEPNSEPLDKRLELGRHRAALDRDLTPERLQELQLAAGVCA